MTPAPKAARSLLTRVATFCSAAAGGWASHRTSTIRPTGTSAGLSRASSFSSVRDLRLPTCPSGSSMPSRTTPKTPASRSSTGGGPFLPPTERYLPAPGGDWQAGWHAGELRRDRGALTGSGPDLEPAAERREPVGHVPLARPHRSEPGVVAGPVVGHGEPQRPVPRPQADAGAGRLGVLGDVLQRLKAAEVHRRLGVLAEPPDPVRLDRHRYRRLAGL